MAGMSLLDHHPAVAHAAFWASLGGRAGSTALLSDDGPVSYAELAGRVDALVSRLGATRRLVLLEARTDLDTVVGYLACLAGRHPVLVVDGEHEAAAAGLVAAYDPDVVLGAAYVERRTGTAHDLHPELAVLLSTSGSTGSPKLVRLSADNVAANAKGIATVLGIRPDDVAATTLPLHYCYGLSVLTSHLAAGAAVMLTRRSVVDPVFWDDVRRHRVTTFPGVPHTFDLLDRVGFADLELPSLRYLTCAGGRLAPATVHRYAALGRRRGFDLRVMYGATEATARMAVLPAQDALTRPGALGDPVPGGSFTLRPPRAAGSRPASRGSSSSDPRLPALGEVGEVGELVYAGENVMLGYATAPADLARGREVTELRTGDLARRTADGLEIVGRVARRAKVFGHRVDLDQVEAALLAAGVVGVVADGGDRVVVAVDSSAAAVDPARVRRVVEELGVPAAGLSVVTPAGLPRLASGKPDLVALVALAQEVRPRSEARNGTTPATERGALQVLAEVLGDRRTVTDDDSFVTLGGDSLSYVEVSLRLQRVLGHLPPDWHRLTVRELDAARETPRRGAKVETNVVLRAAAIVMIVGSHANLFTLLGGAHLLVGLAGFNFARFQLTDRSRRERVSGLARSTARIAVPSVLWLSFAAATSAKYDLLNVTLLNGVLGSRGWTESWHYWFVEAIVWTLVALCALIAIPWVDRTERRWPFWTPYTLAVVALLTRYDVVRLFGGDVIHRAHVIFWLFALGWAAVKAPTRWHRLLVSATVVLTVPGFFDGDRLRESIVVVGMLLLVWLPAVRLPRVVARSAGVLASASLYIYLCHWQIYPAYEFELPWLATGLSLAAGVAFWWVVTRVSPWLARGTLTPGRDIGGRPGWLCPRR